jgi:ribosomal protein S18 acetylase RimI-like enzyme
MKIRAMTSGDVTAGLDLCRAAGWNQTAADWRHFLGEAPHGVLAAEDAGRVVGTVATMPYGPFTWIAMVLVDPTARGHGIGTRLLEQGLSLVPDDIVARLDATPLGEPIYRKLGFAEEYGLARLTRNPGLMLGRVPALNPERTQPGDKVTVRSLLPADWPAVFELDTRVFGASRATLLTRLATEAAEYAWIAEDGEMCGYVLGRHGHVREHIGPLVADSPHTAERLLSVCLAARAPRGVLIDAPDNQVAWRARLADLGFTIERPFLRMSRGTLTTAGDPSWIYAVTGPEFG